MSKKESKRERPLYSQKWIARYGQGLKREEIRLVQGYRGLSARQREGLLMLVSGILMENVRANIKAGAR